MIRNSMIAMTMIALAFQGLGCEGSGGSSATPSTSRWADDQGVTSDASATKTDTKLKAKQRREKRRRSGPLSKSIENPLPAPTDVGAIPDDAEKTDSGLASRLIKKGRGRQRPGPNDAVKVHYTGWTTDGINFDSSVVRGEASEFRLSQVIRGWSEGLQLMNKGEKRRFWIPEELAYKGRRGKPLGMLVFDVELLRITKAPPLPPVPEDVSGPPEGAEKSDSGLAWRIIKEGRGTERPGPTSKVKLKYTGWEPDGRLFRSTILDGQPAVMPLDRISSKGLSEALQLMVKGEVRRVWIPAELAYKSTGTGPEGMVVMDLELLSIMN